MTIGKSIVRYRTLNKLTTKKLGSLVGVSSSCISKYETGKLSVSTKMLAKIAQALDVQISDLFPQDNYASSRVVQNKFPSASDFKPAVKNYTIHFLHSDTENNRMVSIAEDICPDPDALAIRVSDDSLMERGILKGDIVLVSKKVKPRTTALVAIIANDSVISLRLLLEYSPGKKIVTVTCDGKYQLQNWQDKDKLPEVYPIICVIRSMTEWGIFDTTIKNDPEPGIYEM